MTANREPTQDELTIRHRSMSVEIDQAALAVRAAADPADDLLPISISSEYGVERFSFWDNERYIEVLEHSADAIDLSRAQNGMPFLDSHNARDGRAQMGRVLNVRLGSDNRLRGDVRFSKRQEAQDYRRDMIDGIRTEISVGYRIDPNNIETIQGRDDKLPTKRIKRWTPYEVSGVSIPADPTVGVGRSEASPGPDAIAAAVVAALRSTPPDTAPQAKEVTMPDEKKPDLAANGAAARAEARTEAKAIVALAKEHKHVLGDTEARIAKWLDEDATVRDVSDEILRLYNEAAAKAPKPAPAVDLSAAEQKRYSYARAVQHLVDGIDGKRVGPSFETEVSDECAKRAPDGYTPRGGIFMPTAISKSEVQRHNAANGPFAGIMRREMDKQFRENVELAIRAGLDSATATKGAELKFTVPGPFLEVLRNLMAVYQAGATSLTGLQGPMAFINQTTPGTAVWAGENAGSDIADSNLLLQQITLVPKTVMSSTSYSRQLWTQSVIDIDGKVKSDLAAIIAIALDLAGLNGTGASNQPTGILNTAGIGSLALAANGATPTYNNLVDLESLVTQSNADQWPLTYFVHPTNRGTFKKAVALTNTVGVPVWTKGDVGLESGALAGIGSRTVGELNGYPAFATNQLPNTLVKGTSSNCMPIIFGAFSKLVIGDWGVFELIVDPYRLKKQAMIELTAFAMYGVLVEYAAAFAAVKDSLA